MLTHSLSENEYKEQGDEPVASNCFNHMIHKVWALIACDIYVCIVCDVLMFLFDKNMSSVTISQVTPSNQYDLNRYDIYETKTSLVNKYKALNIPAPYHFTL